MLEKKFSKMHLWQKLADKISLTFNLHFQAAQVENKWKYLTMIYRQKINDRRKTGGGASKNWKWFNQMDSALCERPNTEPICEGGSGLSSKAPILKRRFLDEVEEAEESSVRKAKIAKTTSAQTLDRILEMQENQNEFVNE